MYLVDDEGSDCSNGDYVGYFQVDTNDNNEATWVYRWSEFDDGRRNSQFHEVYNEAVSKNKRLCFSLASEHEGWQTNMNIHGTVDSDFNFSDPDAYSNGGMRITFLPGARAMGSHVGC